MTKDEDKRDAEGKKAPMNTSHSDPRLIAFVRMLGRFAAESDISDYLKVQGAETFDLKRLKQ